MSKRSLIDGLVKDMVKKINTIKKIVITRGNFLMNAGTDFDTLPENSKMELVLYGALEYYLKLNVEHARTDDIKKTVVTLKLVNFISDKITQIIDQKQENDNV